MCPLVSPLWDCPSATGTATPEKAQKQIEEGMTATPENAGNQIEEGMTATPERAGKQIEEGMNQDKITHIFAEEMEMSH